MKLFRFKKSDGSSNFVNIDQIQWIESTNAGESCVLHMAGGAKILSGSPTEELVKAMSGDPRTGLVPKPPTGGPVNEPPAIDFAQIKVQKRAKAE